MAAPMLRWRRMLRSIPRFAPLCATLSRGCLHPSKSCVSTSRSDHTYTKPALDPVELKEKFRWMNSQAPVFGISGDTVSILAGPSSYFNTVKSLIRRSKKRLVLASLYLGTGAMEQELVVAMKEALLDSPDLEVTILIDCTRGSRGQHNSRTMLLPLLRQFPGRVNIALYHTPDLRGILKRLIPERYNEVVGLSHLKVYIFDDTFVTSGANLSDAYFTNRQDRYIRIDACPHLVSFYELLVKAICSFSFQLHADNSLTVDEDFGIHPYEGDEKEFRERAKATIESIITPDGWSRTFERLSQGEETLEDDGKNAYAKEAGNVDSEESCSQGGSINTTSHEMEKSMPGIVMETNKRTKHSDDSKDFKDLSESNGDNELTCNQSSRKTGQILPNIGRRKVDTWIYPLVQMGPLNICVDQKVTAGILENLDEGSRLHLASGYFNLTQQYKAIILRSRAKCEILLASPQVNGFYGASGISGYIPDSYTYIAKKFYRAVCRRKLQERIGMHEYYRDGWTFHAKGLWYYLPGQSLPSLSLIGSPNFGHRSVSRDLESQLAILTTNENLQQQLHQEQETLYSRAETVDDKTYEKPDRKVALWAKLVTIIAHNFY